MNTAYAAAVSAAEETASASASEIAKAVDFIITKIPFAIAGLLIIIISIGVAKLVRSMVITKLAEKGVEEDHKELQVLSGRIAYTAILTLGITAGLEIAGIDLTTIIAAVAFGIGFALKDLIMNFLAGIMILVSRHFTIGDFIEVGGTVGKIEEIQSRVTLLKSLDGTRVIVPNAELFKKQVTSMTSNPMRKFALEVTIDYRNNLQNAIKIALNSAKTAKGVLIEPKASVTVVGFGDHGVNIKIKAWCDSKGGWVKIKSRVAENLKKAFDEHGIIIPYPIHTILNDKDRVIKEKTFVEKIEPKKPAPQAAPLAAAPQPQAVPVPVPVQEPPQPPAADTPLRPLGE